VGLCGSCQTKFWWKHFLTLRIFDVQTAPIEGGITVVGLGAALPASTNYVYDNNKTSRHRSPPQDWQKDQRFCTLAAQAPEVRGLYNHIKKPTVMIISTESSLANFDHPITWSRKSREPKAKGQAGHFRALSICFDSKKC